MKGCKNCPAFSKCTVTYRGSACAALRYTYGLEDDPEIKTNADRIRAMSDEELAKYITNRTQYQPSPGSRKSYGGAYGNSYLEFHEAALDWLYWLQQPAKEDVHE